MEVTSTYPGQFSHLITRLCCGGGRGFNAHPENENNDILKKQINNIKYTKHNCNYKFID